MVTKLSDNIYIVKSENSGNVYKVIINGNVIKCACKGYQFRRKCSHIEEVKKVLGDRKVRVKSVPSIDNYSYVNKYKHFFERR